MGLNLDAKLTFNDHINEKIGKAMKGVSLLRKLQCSLPRSSLLTIYESFIRPHLDYGEVIYDKVPKYIYELIPPFIHSFRNPNSFTSFTCTTEFFKNSYFPSVINNWNKLDPKIRNSTAGSLSYPTAKVKVRPPNVLSLQLTPPSKEGC